MSAEQAREAAQVRRAMDIQEKLGELNRRNAELRELAGRAFRAFEARLAEVGADDARMTELERDALRLDRDVQAAADGIAADALELEREFTGTSEATLASIRTQGLAARIRPRTAPDALLERGHNELLEQATEDAGGQG